MAPASDSKPKKKICCACPDVKKLRDECIVEHGESACEKWIEDTKDASVQKVSIFEIEVVINSRKLDDTFWACY